MADYSKGSITLIGPNGTKTYESIKAECGGGTKVSALDVTHNGTFEAPEGEGYSPINVNVPVQSGSLKKLLDTTKSTYHLFYHYNGSSVEGLINYDDTSNVTDMSYMFYNCQKLMTIPLLDTSNVTDMSYMFCGCNSLTTIPLLNTSNVTSMNSMFYNCYSLTTIPLLNTSNVTNMSNMFYYCQKLMTIPLLDTSNVTSMSYMFYACQKLMTIPLLDTSNVTSMNNMFYGCNSLTTIIIKNTTKIPPLSTNSFNYCYHFTGTVNSQYNPEGLKDGRIYVPDDKVEEFKTATNWSVFADIIVPLSTYKDE